MTRSTEEFVRVLRLHLQEEVQREIRDGHGFFRKWYAGKLTRDQVAAFYQTNYFESLHAGRLLGRLLSLAPDRDSFNVIGQNLSEELGHGNFANSHPELILGLAVRLGRPLSRVLEEGPVVPLVTLWADVGMKYAELSFAAGLASFTYIEAGVPSRHARQRQGLIEHYGVARADVAYHDQHLSLEAAEQAGGKNITDEAVPGYGGDDVHVERQLGRIAALARSDQEQERVLESVSATCDAKIKYYCQADALIASGS
jgi:pyrroloquinoline quinone (PQQ) biosynthesis protein C